MDVSSTDRVSRGSAVPAARREGETETSPTHRARVLYEERPVAAVAAIVALATAAFCFVTAENLPVGLLPIIASGLHSSDSAVGLLVSAYALVVVVSSAPLTHLTRRVPRRLLVCGLLGTFMLASLASGLAHSYWWLMSARVFGAMAQAVFWSVVAVAAVGLFPPSVRAKAVAGVMSGGSLAVVLGVPAGTWLGQQGGWRLPFYTLSGLAALSLVAVAILLPTVNPAHSHAAAGTNPDRRRFYALVAATILFVGGAFASFTYISTFLLRVSGLPKHDLAAVLLVNGAASACGVAATGALFDRHPKVLTLGPFVVMTGGLFSLWAFGHSPLPAVLAEAAVGIAIGSFVIANQNRVLIVAPGSSDVASAWASASFNAGIGGGSLVGGLVLPALGVSATALTGGLLAGAGLVIVLVDHFMWAPPGAAAQVAALEAAKSG